MHSFDIWQKERGDEDNMKDAVLEKHLQSHDWNVTVVEAAGSTRVGKTALKT